MTVDSNALRATMRQWVTGVTVVTTTTPTPGEYVGMTVSSFTSVSLEPPTVLVCINKNTGTHDPLLAAGTFAVSMLGVGQELISNRFAGFDPTVTTHAQRFDGLGLHVAVTGAPLIQGAVGWLDCVVREKVETGTHTIFIGEVVFAQAFTETQPLVYYNRSYQLMTPIQQQQS